MIGLWFLEGYPVGDNHGLICCTSCIVFFRRKARTRTSEWVRVYTEKGICKHGPRSVWDTSIARTREFLEEISEGGGGGEAAAEDAGEAVAEGGGGGEAVAEDAGEAVAEGGGGGEAVAGDAGESGVEGGGDEVVEEQPRKRRRIQPDASAAAQATDAVPVAALATAVTAPVAPLARNVVAALARNARRPGICRSCGSPRQPLQVGQLQMIRYEQQQLRATVNYMSSRIDDMVKTLDTLLFQIEKNNEQ